MLDMARRIAEAGWVFATGKIQGAPQWFARGADYDTMTCNAGQLGKGGIGIVQVLEYFQRYHGIDGFVFERKAVDGRLEELDRGISLARGLQ